MTAIINGREIPVEWMWEFKNTEKLLFEFADTRKISEIAPEIEGSTVIERKSAEEGDITYEGYTDISRIMRYTGDNGETLVQIELVKGLGK